MKIKEKVTTWAIVHARCLKKIVPSTYELIGSGNNARLTLSSQNIIATVSEPIWLIRADKDWLAHVREARQAWLETKQALSFSLLSFHHICFNSTVLDLGSFLYVN